MSSEKNLPSSEPKHFAIDDGVYKIDASGEKFELTDKKLEDFCSGSACGYIKFSGTGGPQGWNFTNKSTKKTIKLTTKMFWINCVSQPARMIGPGASINVVFGPIPGIGYATMCLPFQADFV
jgi:hypothetical protein